MRYLCAVILLTLGCASAPEHHSRYLALGDSYTIGESVAVADRYPVQLARELKLGEPEIIAKTGWTTDELNAAIDKAMVKADPHGPYDLVTLLIGVNNQYRGRDVRNYRTEFGALLQRAIALAGDRPAHVVVVSIPDWAVTPFGRSSGRDTSLMSLELDLYNAANAQIAGALHARYCDVTLASRDRGDHRDMLVGDGLHPSASMYRRWLNAILPQARAALGAA